MGHASTLDHSGRFQFNWLMAKMLKQPHSTAEQDRYQVDLNFVKQAGSETLLQRACAADRDILLADNDFGLRNGAFHTIGHKRKQGPFLNPFLRNPMRQHNHRPIDRMLAPYALAMSNVRRPVTMTPVVLLVSSSCAALAAEILKSQSPPAFYTQCRRCHTK